MKRPEIARRIENAVRAAIIEAGGTADIGGTAATRSVTDSLIRHLAVDGQQGGALAESPG